MTKRSRYSRTGPRIDNPDLPATRNACGHPTACGCSAGSPYCCERCPLPDCVYQNDMTWSGPRLLANEERRVAQVNRARAERARGLGQEEIAEEMMVSVRTVSRRSNGR